MALEIERKYLEVDFDSLRRRLRQYGAQGGDVHLERNRIYDLPDGSLRAGHHLLRLRSQEWPDHAQKRADAQAAARLRAGCGLQGP